MAFDGDTSEREALFFPEWVDALEGADLAPATRASYKDDIIAFFRFCKVVQAPANVIMVRQFLERPNPNAVQGSSPTGCAAARTESGRCTLQPVVSPNWGLERDPIARQ